MRQACLGVCVAQILRVLLAGLGFRSSGHRRDAHEELDVARVAAFAGDGFAHACHQLLQAFLRLAGHEHAFGVARGERLAAAGGSRLVEHGRALARGFGQVVALNPVVLAGMVYPPHCFGVRVDAAALVGADGIVVPAAFP
ncbi:hypothetical protein D3C87_1450680 [compost metagenome]